MPVTRARGRLLVVLIATVTLAAACTSTEPAVERAEGSTVPESGETAPQTAAPSGPVPDDAVRIGLGGPVSFDLAAASSAAVADVLLADLLYDTLTVIDEQGQVQPGLATFSANADLDAWRFELDPDATFADGTPITATDVVASITRARDADTLLGLRLDLAVTLLAPSPSVVEIGLNTPTALLPELLATPLAGIAPAGAFDATAAGGLPPINPSGDYTVETDGSRLVLTRREGDGPETIVVERYETETAAVNAFLAGDLDWTIAPPDRLGDVVDEGGVADLTPFHGSIFLGVDASVAPLDDERLRRAIALALDRSQIPEEAYGPAATALDGLVPAGVPGGGEECRGICGPDRDEATRLVAEVFPEGQERPLRLLIDDTAAQGAVASIVESQLDAVGLDVEVDAQPVANYEQLVTTGRPQLFLFGWLGVTRSPADHIAPLFASGSPDNVTGMADDVVDLGIAAANLDPIPASRLASWQDLETSILGRVPVVPLVQLRTTAVRSERLEGFELRADGSVDVSNATVSPMR